MSEEKNQAPNRLLRLILRKYTLLGIQPQEALLALHLVEMGGIVVQTPQAELARRMGITQRRLRDITRSLTLKGFLTVTPTTIKEKYQHANVYDLTAFLIACGER